MTEAERRPVGAVIAMEVELNHLLAEGIVLDENRVGPWRDWRVSIGEQPIVATLAGIGMVNAAAATEHLISTYRPVAVVNSGCTGAHIAGLAPGDVVIGSEVVHHSALQVLASGEERHIGFSFETTGGGIVKSSSLAADPGLLALAVAAGKEAAVPGWPAHLAWVAPEPRRGVRVVTGAIASADVWTQQIERIELLHERHGSLCEDMEAAAVAQIAARYELPFLSVKDISNNERHAQTDLMQESIGFAPDFPLEEAGRRAAKLLAAVLRKLPEVKLG